MDGLSWDDRQPTDWLASNGKWYPASTYPRGWTGTALPPAPGHGGAASILEKYAKMAGIDTDAPVLPTFVTTDGIDRTASKQQSRATQPQAESRQSPPPQPQQRPQQPQRPQAASARPKPRVKTPPPPPNAPKNSGFSVAESGRSVANATVTDQGTYKEKLPSGVPQPAPLSPGRVRDLADEAPPGSPNASPPPPSAPAAPVASNQAPSGSSTPNLDVVSRDLGVVFGSAKQKLRDALNESFEDGGR